jgi:hypothetical protein
MLLVLDCAGDIRVADSPGGEKIYSTTIYAPGLHGARFSNSTNFDILKFRKNSEKNS